MPEPTPPAGRRDVRIDVAHMINKSAREVSLQDLAGKSVKVIDLAHVNNAVNRAIDQALRTYERRIGRSLRKEIGLEANRRFLDLTDQHQQVVRERDEHHEHRRALEGELKDLREESSNLRAQLQEEQENLRAERDRAIDEHSFMLSEAGFRELDRHLRRVLGSVVRGQRRQRILESGIDEARGLSRTERSLASVLRRVLASEQRRVYEQQEALRTREMDVLERRISKLNQTLAELEGTLRQVTQGKAGDPGVASIYREVQGLPEQESNRAEKGAMLEDVFRKNLELRVLVAEAS